MCPPRTNPYPQTPETEVSENNLYPYIAQCILILFHSKCDIQIIFYHDLFLFKDGHDPLNWFQAHQRVLP